MIQRGAEGGKAVSFHVLPIVSRTAAADDDDDKDY